MTSPLVLVVEHEALCPPAWLGEWLTGAGVDLEVFRPYAGQPLPTDLDGHDGLLVLGGSMGAHDDRDAPWLPQVKELVRRAAAERVATLGVCLGHQLATVALGGDAARNPRGQQMGVLDVGWAGAAGDDPLLAAMPRPARAVQWNDDVVTRLPEGATLLAAAGTGEVQAARLAETVWGVQWHPEAGEAIVRSWVEADRDDVQERDVDVERHLAAIAAAHEEMRATWRHLGPAFAGLLA